MKVHVAAASEAGERRPKRGDKAYSPRAPRGGTFGHEDKFDNIDNNRINRIEGWGMRDLGVFTEHPLKFITEYGKLSVKQSKENYAASKLCRGHRAALVISL